MVTEISWHISREYLTRIHSYRTPGYRVFITSRYLTSYASSLSSTGVFGREITASFPWCPAETSVSVFTKTSSLTNSRVVVFCFSLLWLTYSCVSFISVAALAPGYGASGLYFGLLQRQPI